MSGDDIRGFIIPWDGTRFAMRKDRDPEVLDMLLLRHTQLHPQRQHNMAYYERLPLGHAGRNYELL